MPTTTIKVARTAPTYGDEREEVRKIHVNQEGDRYFYFPDHVNEDVMTSEGYARVTDVTDHECGGADECPVNEIDLPDYREKS